MLCRRRFWLPALVCASICAATAPRARADELPQAATEQNTDLARQLFNEGLDAVEHERWNEAEDRFRRVLALRSSHVVSYNLGSALMHLGRLVESAELLRAIVRDASAEPTTRDAATQLLSDIEPRIGTLTIRVSGDASGASFSLDDKPIEVGGQVQTLAVDPGEHRVALQRDGNPLEQRSVAIGNGQPLQAELSFELPARVLPRAAALPAPSTPTPLPIATASPDRDRESGSSSSSIFTRPWFWVGVGAVVAGGVVTAFLLASSSHTRAAVSGDIGPSQIHGRVQMDMVAP